MKKRTKRKGVRWYVWLMLVLLFFGCGKGDDSSESAPAEQEETVEEMVEDSQIEKASIIVTEQPKKEEPEVTVVPEEETESVVESYEMKVHFLDVEQGLSILVQSGDDVLIYDGGDRSTSSFVVAYLKEQGVSNIDYLISSHYDSDHVYGLIGCLNAFDVEHVISSDYEHDSQTYEKFVSTVQKMGLEAEHPSVGTEYDFGTGKFTILAPQSINENESNENSVVIKLENGDHSFIFTGDADYHSEAMMCSSGLDLSCTVLSIGHHGSDTATSWDFLEETVPEFAVISCGIDNQYGHPNADVMEKLESMEIELYRSDKQGTVVAESDGESLTWDTEPCNDYTPGETYDEPAEKVQEKTATADVQEPLSETEVWISATGEKYHTINDCGRMNPDKATKMTKSEAENRGLEPCSKCF